MKKCKTLFAVLAAMLVLLVLMAGCGKSNDAPPPPQETAPNENDAPAPSPEAEPSEELPPMDFDDSDYLGPVAKMNLNSFKAETMSGESWSEANFADKDITVVNFWASWCSPCVGELPNLAKFEQALPDNVQLVTFTVDMESDLDAARQLIADNGFTGTALLKPEGDLKAISDEVMSIPMSLFFDKDGNNLGKNVLGGYTDYEDLKAEYLGIINSLLKDMGKDEITVG